MKTAPVRANRWLVAAAAGGMALLAAAPARSQDFGPLERALRASSYQLYNPPRANWGPGFVFAGRVVGGRITDVEEICPNLYADLDPPPGASVVLPDYTANDSFSIGLAVKFLKDLFGLDVDVEKVQSEKTISVKWTNLREYSYTRMDQWLKDGAVRPIALRCRLAIQDLKAKNQFADRIFVIARAVAPEALLYDFGSSVDVRGSASAQLLEQAKGKLQGKAQLMDNTRLETKERLYVGYAAPAKITAWLPTGLVSGELIEVRAEPTGLIIAE